MSTERPTDGQHPENPEDPEASRGSGDSAGPEDSVAHGGQDRHDGQDGHDGAAERGGRPHPGSRPEPAEQHDHAADAPGPAGAEAPSTPGPAARSRRSRYVVGAVAAAVLLAGGGGAYVAATAGSGTDGAAAPGTDGTPPVLALDGYHSQAAPGGSDRSGRAGIAPGEPDPHGPGATVYRASGTLPKGPSSAPVYRTAGTVTADQVSRLAEALHVKGAPKQVAGAWQVGGSDTGPALQVTRQSPGTWSFTRPAAAGPGDNCKKGTVCSGATGGGSGKPVSEARAKAVAAPVLKALGQDGAKLDATRLVGSTRLVNAEPVRGGLPTYGWSTGIRVGTDGAVTAGSGKLLTPVKGATYPVLDANRTLELLNASRPASMPPSPCPATEERAGGPCSGQLRGARTQGRSVPVTGAVFGLATHYESGRPVLVPSWLFEVKPQGAADSYTLTYPAVDPKYLKEADGSTSPGGTESPGGSGGTDRVHLVSYTSDDSKLRVHFYGGVCSTYSASAKETADRVTVTVTEHEPAKDRNCIMIAKKITKTVTLKEPLGDRKVVDATGATVHRD